MRARLLLLAFVSSPMLAAQQAPPPSPQFRVEEATIAQIHDAMKSGRLTCHALVEAYLRRIDAYDKNGPALNAIVVVNPAALRVADSLDTRFRRDGLVGPL